MKKIIIGAIGLILAVIIDWVVEVLIVASAPLLWFALNIVYAVLTT